MEVLLTKNCVLQSIHLSPHCALRKVTPPDLRLMVGAWGVVLLGCMRGRLGVMYVWVICSPTAKGKSLPASGLDNLWTHQLHNQMENYYYYYYYIFSVYQWNCALKLNFLEPGTQGRCRSISPGEYVAGAGLVSHTWGDGMVRSALLGGYRSMVWPSTVFTKSLSLCDYEQNLTLKWKKILHCENSWYFWLKSNHTKYFLNALIFLGYSDIAMTVLL